MFINQNIYLILKEVDECLSDPCLNGGRCTDRIDAYTCTCHASFIGINCQYGMFCEI